MLGVVNEFPVNNGASPVEASYHLFPEAVALKSRFLIRKLICEVELTVGRIVHRCTTAVRVDFRSHLPQRQHNMFCSGDT
jgi:hypothetical protein